LKAHLAAEPETGIITATELSPGNSGDAEAAPGLLSDEPAGTEVLGDAAYGSGELREHLEQGEMTAVIKAMPLRPAVDGGYTLDDFEIDETAGTITCPEGITVTINKNRRARFAKHCATCPLRRRCTKSKAGRTRTTIVLHPNHDLLAAARNRLWLSHRATQSIAHDGPSARPTANFARNPAESATAGVSNTAEDSVNWPELLKRRCSAVS
jgi:hypothetical protein